MSHFRDSYVNASASSWLSAQALRLSLSALRTPDVGRAQARGARLGHLAWKLDPKWRAIGESQLQRYLPEVDAEDIVRRNYAHYGKILAEIASMEAILARGESMFTYEGTEIIEELSQDGRGIMLVSAHLGNWEILGLAHQVRFGSLSALVKPIRNAYIDQWITENRQRIGVNPLMTRDNAKHVLKYLKEGGTLAVLADQNSLYHEGIFVPFFGEPASTHYGPAMLALRANAHIVPGFGTRMEDGRFHIRYESPIEPPAQGTLREKTWAVTAALTERIEAAVRRTPEQWFWVHKRWKNQPKEDTPAWKLPPK